MYTASYIGEILCRYLAAKSEADHYTRELKREEEEIIAVPDTGQDLSVSQLFFLH